MTVEIREALPDDAEQLIALIELLPHRVTAAGVRERIERISVDDFPQLVAVDDGAIVGLCGLHRMTAIHREQPVGRITILVVAEAARGKGVGRQLVDAAEEMLRAAGCGMIELTSNDWLVEAHQFYRKIGYEQTSKRFAKQF
jgi:GNAT superfamily N-acetyltransferase